VAIDLQHCKLDKSMIMKKVMLMVLLSAVLFNLNTAAQKVSAAKVPAVVKNSFTRDFPGANATWEKEKGNYEAGFKQSSSTVSALYDASGNKIETEKDIPIASLPAAVSTYITNNYKGEKIKEAAIITRANGEINYEAEVKATDLLFSKDGNFIKMMKD
jgi:hypothetical protein